MHPTRSTLRILLPLIACLLGPVIALAGQPATGQRAAGQPAAQAAPPVNDEAGFQPLFPEDGEPKGWVARHWADVSQPPKEPTRWEVRDGILLGGVPRGSWLISEREYGDLELRFQFKLGPRGNGGCALRTPPAGDPAFDGLELQMADLRYNPEAKASELTGGLYRAVAPREQVYRPEEWNDYQIILIGSRISVKLNGVLILNENLDEQTEPVLRHDGKPAPPLKDRPRRGRIGFQELSRDDGRVQIRNARIRLVD